METPRVDIGISENERKDVANSLAHFLADTYTLYLMTHNFHWNVTGPMFRSLHLMFEEQYVELAEAVDVIAERIRTIGYPAPGTYRELSSLTSIKEPEGVPSAEEMVRQLVQANESVIRSCRSALPHAQNAGDESTVGLLSDRMRVHEKAAWMLRSLI